MEKTTNTSSEFEIIKGKLERIVGQLDEVVVGENGEVEKGKIDEILKEIDDYISTAPTIKRARITGISDFQNLITYINEQVATKLRDLKSKVSEEEQQQISKSENEYNLNKTNVTQSYLKRVAYLLKPKTPQELEEIVVKRRKQLNGVVNFLPEWNNKVTKNCNYEEDVLNDIEDRRIQLSEIAHRESVRRELEKSEIREQITRGYEEFCQLFTTGTELTDDDYKKILEFVKKLKPYRMVPEIKEIADKIIQSFSKNENGISVDDEKLKQVANENKK